jgi:hypothetical protein
MPMFGRKSPLAANIALSFVRQNAEKGGRQARPKKKSSESKRTASRHKSKSFIIFVAGLEAKKEEKRSGEATFIRISMGDGVK